MPAFDTARFAAIADIHGNADALLAVLDDIGRQGIAGIVNLGDHLSGPLAVRETADILLAQEMIAIRGNHDRWLAGRNPSEMGPWERDAVGRLDDKHFAWLRALPPTQTIGDVFLCHGTPASDITYWLEKVAPDGSVLQKTLDEVSREADGIAASLILCGHTHLPRRVDLPDGPTIVNPGSVGCPAYDDDIPVFHLMQTGTPAASYAILEKTGKGWISSFRRVPYDTRRMVAMARDGGHDDWAQALATGWLR